MKPRRSCLALALLAFAALPASASAARFLSPAPGEQLVPGEVVTLRWAGAPSDSEEMELLLSLDGGEHFSVRLTRELAGDATSFRWLVPRLPAQSVRLALRAEVEGHEVVVGESAEFAITVLDPRQHLDWSLRTRDGEIWLVDACSTATEPLWDKPLDFQSVPAPAQLSAGASEVALAELRTANEAPLCLGAAPEGGSTDTTLPPLPPSSLRFTAPLPLRI